jgi:hypothetical protein
MQKTVTDHTQSSFVKRLLLALTLLPELVHCCWKLAVVPLHYCVLSALSQYTDLCPLLLTTQFVLTLLHKQFANLPELFLEVVDKYEKEENVLALVTHREDADRMRQQSFKPDVKDSTAAPPSSYANGVSSSDSDYCSS